ncbi:hypothetical protein K402DRAFT_456904 [Aulographum hederae CBS 113979]|uniref:Uncharacterized protein n=1 Tax=Aulographum hederae CBS 113979 TaxID=1176131 RepID=A0A6G1GQP4_9PEZI|nr:hypothetical protein K402DRAFT_456904 [Aulographum hederae CBS 113979]
MPSVTNTKPAADQDSIPTTATTIATFDATHFRASGARGAIVRYGPYVVPPSTAITPEVTFTDTSATKPCDDCLITLIQAGLEFANGTTVEGSSAFRLESAVLLDTARSDTTCGEGESELPLTPLRFFVSGNERVPVSLSANGTQKTGYHLTTPSSLFLLTALSNRPLTPPPDPAAPTPEPIPLYLTLTFEYIHFPLPQGFQSVLPAWLDIGGCVDSTLPIPAPAPNTSADTFSLSAPNPWTVSRDISGRIVAVAGLLNNGATGLQVLKNNESVCRPLVLGTKPAQPSSQEPRHQQTESELL